MESDSFFWLLLKKLPETLFALLGLPIERAAAYRFDAVEIKKSYRHDGLCVPNTSKLPVCFVEVQFQRRRHFYANLFAKVFSYLDANDPDQDFLAVALFASRKTEPKPQPAFQALLASANVRRIYLDELEFSERAAPGLQLLQLVSAPAGEARERVAKLIRAAKQEFDCERTEVIIELAEELLMRRFTELNREEIRRMFKLHDLSESRAWQEIRQEGLEEGLEKGGEKKERELVKRLQAKGKSLKEIADLFDIPLAEVRRLARAEK